MPPHTWRWRVAYAAILLAGLLIFLSWLAPWARADDISGTYRATVYGPCCDGNVSRDGRTWYRFDWTRHVTVAHATIPRGTRMLIWVPAQPDAANVRLRTIGALVWSYEDGAPLTVTDACAIDWDTACPPWQLDLSYALIVRAGFCTPEQDPYRCMAVWGRRQVYLWSVSPAPDRPRPSFGVVPQR